MQVISLSVMVFCFALVKSTPYETNGNDVRIFRGKRDIFTRTVGCNDSNAVCFNETCTYCQCMVNQTFLRTRGPYGQCVSNELVVYATSDEDYFLLQSVRHKRCLYQTSTKWGTFVFVSTTCSHDNENSRWIWTNYGQLLNWKTMECMTDGLLFRQEHLVTMKKCDRRNQKQLWECVGDKKYNIRQTQSRKDLYFGEHRQYVTTSWSTARKWVRHGSNKDFCSKGVGCEKFADGSSLIILNETKCEEQSKCLGEKVISMNGTKCFVLPNKTQYLHNNKWEAMEIKTGSFAMFSSMDKVSLKWNLRKVPNSWKGLMVKVRFMCEDGADKTEHCVVVKLMGTFTGFRKGGGEDSDDSGKDDGKVGDSKAGADNGDMVNKDKIDVDQESKGGDRDNTKTIIIIVCVLVVVLLSGVIVFIIYRYRHGRTRSKRGYKGRQCNATILDEVQPSTTNQPAQRESQLYEVPCERHYEYVDKTAIILPQTFTYDYASVDGTLENDRELRVKPVITEEGDYVNKKTDTEDRDTHDDYVIKIPDTEDRNTHDDYVIKKPDTEDKDMHDDYVIKKPDTEDKDMHDDYVIKKTRY